ncbi:hypothetical protein BDB01DRAFT_857355 [Pilobolus umbonatus]|nr:hypothetical protein BDB01DRAFT_857355 [Pilobolus umbonatus]
MSDWVLLYNQSDILLVIKKSASISSPVPVPLLPSSTGYLMCPIFCYESHISTIQPSRFTLEEFGDMVERYNADNELAGFRTVPRVNAELKSTYKPTNKNNKTPPMHLRIYAAIGHSRSLLKEEPLGDEDMEEHLKKLRSLARDVKSLISVDGFVSGKKWHEIDSRFQMYYALQFEALAAEKSVRIDLCKDQWIARNLLSEAIVAPIDNKKRRTKKREDVRSQMRSDNVELISSSDKNDCWK